MLALEEVCSRYVTSKGGPGLPEIHAVIAGYTDRDSTRFLTACGVKDIGTKEPAMDDSMMCFYSCTKSMTAMAILILYDRGLVELDTPAKKYLPILGNFGVLQEGQVDANTGDLKTPLQKAVNDVTIRHLLLHMSGFAYLITDNSYYQIMGAKKIFEPSEKMFTPPIMPLVFEPGTAWKYGHSFDWLGLIVEAVSGKKLSQFMRENIFDKAGMDSCTFQMLESSKMVRMHDKSGEDIKVWDKRLPAPYTSSIDMGGHGCFGTVSDYLKFMRIWLNYGTSPDTGERILSRETVGYAVQNHLPANQSTDFPTPFADASDGYSLIGCGYTGRGLETGRPEGALFWAGYANLYFWLDLKNGCAGFWGTQILPYMDDRCVNNFKEFETAVYKDLDEKSSKIQSTL